MVSWFYQTFCLMVAKIFIDIIKYFGWLLIQIWRLYFSTKAVNIHFNFLLPNCRRLCSFILNLIQQFKKYVLKFIFKLLNYKIIIGFVKYSLWYRYPLPGINLQGSYLLKQLITTCSFLWLLLGLTTVLGDCDNAVTKSLITILVDSQNVGQLS